MRAKLLILALVTASLSYAQISSYAQTPGSPGTPALPNALPSFEVASVRPTPPGAGAGYWSIPGIGRFTAVNVSLDLLIQLAYGVDDSQIVNKPGWLDTECYNVSAKPEDGVVLTREELKPRLQSLLEERFHLAAHRETRLVQGYALVVAKNGPKLQPTTGGHFPGFRANVGAGNLQGFNWSMPYCALMLTAKVRYPVVDKTGLSGSYDIHVQYAPERSKDSPLPSLFTALKETLGLQLDAQKVPAEMVVIDHVDKVATDN